MRKIERDITTMCHAEGFALRGIEHRRGHLRLLFDAGFVTAPGTPSCNRNLRHVRAAVRRLHA